MNNVVEFLRGKKTYFTVAIALLYLAGCYLKFWDFDEKVLAVFGVTGLAFLRAGVMKGPNVFLCFLLSGFCFCGCATALKSDKIISETSWIVGLRIKTSDSTSGNPLPDVQLGVMRQTIHMIPTSTNSPVYAPRFGNAYAGKQNAYDPIALEAQESVFSGDVMVSTNATGGAVIPKLVPPKFQ